MLKPEAIQSLKKNNISRDAEKTMQRLRAIWQPLAKAQREEILSLADIKKVSIERAYKTGGVSAKVIIAIAQVLNLDPLYFTGESDEQGTFDAEAVISYLAALGYDIGKSDISKKAKSQARAANPTAPKRGRKPKSTSAEPINAEPTDAEPTIIEATIPALCNAMLDMVEPSTLQKLDSLTEEDAILLYTGLCIQSDFCEEKKDRIALIKYLLLM